LVIHTLFICLNKAENWKLANVLGELECVNNITLTCYNGIIADGCGEFPSCMLRNKGYDDYMKMLGELN
ncbi:UNVERIFIED_CONTAM: 7-cyano-7-deazaguanine synthase QueC, partial [Bacillus amyloliquefaciens DSM 7 = ATCC 23350]